MVDDATVEHSAPRLLRDPEPCIEVETVSKVFRRNDGSTVAAVDEVSLVVSKGEFVVLLGPSGCGKTTLLRSVAGLETPNAGRIQIEGKVVFDGARRVNLPPEHRDVSLVFQSYALWPHMTALQNVGFPLQVKQKLARARARKVAQETLDMVGIGALSNQYPGQLSGGQQQRVALARALASGSKAVLFDEPLSNVDAKTREELRRQIVTMQRELGFSALYVTHDQSEALTMADRIAVFRDGRIQQLGAPESIYRVPADDYVGSFVGTANLLAAESNGDGQVHTAVGTLLHDRSMEADDDIQVLIRPEAIRLQMSPDGSPNQIKGKVVASMFAGAHLEYIVLVGDIEFIVWRPSAEVHAEPGTAVWLSVDSKDVHILHRSAT